MTNQVGHAAMADWGVIWMIRLRWVAAIGLVAAPLSAGAFGIHLPAAIFVALGVLVASYNALLNLWVRRTDAVAESGIHAQIIADLVALTAVFHFAGGVENPLLPFYAFHVIIGAIVLSRRASFGYAIVAVGLMLSLGLAERAGMLAHWPLGDPLADDRYRRAGFVALIVSAEAVVLLTVAYLSSVIADVLRNREAELLESNRSIAEQDRLKSRYVQLLAHSMMRRLEDVEQAVTSSLRDLPQAGADAPRGMLLRAKQWLASLHQFMQDVVELSRIRAAGTLATSYVYLPRIVYQQVQDLVALANERQIQIATDLPDGIPPLQGDPQALGQAVQNVLRNAIVYGSTGSTVRVGLGRHENVLDVTIENEGMGIATEDLPHVFDEFYRATRTHVLEPRGSGLGLSIAKHVLEQHGGSIRVASEEGKGCRFVLSLPLEHRERGNVTPANPAPANRQS
jgi:signal transduction histidine kinase